MKKDFKSGLIVFIILLVVISAVSIGSLFVPKAPEKETTIENTIKKTYKKASPENKTGEYVAIVNIVGTIESQNEKYNQQWLISTIDKLIKDSKNLGMTIYINSPGGAVYQADEVYLKLKDYTASGKKLYVYMGPMAASGGYYIACAGDKIWANRNTLTGSIGVIAGQSLDMTEMLEKVGIKSETIHAGKNKNMMNFNEPFTQEQKEIMQSIADECYDQFCGIVSKERKMSMEKVHELADGRIYTAQQAFINGLIDNIGSLDNMMEQLCNYELKNPGLKIVSYDYDGKKDFMYYLTGKVKAATTSVNAAKLGIPEKLLNDINGFNSYPAYIYN